MDSTLRTTLLLIPAAPLASALFTAVFGARLLGKNSHWPTILAILFSCVCSLSLVAKVADRQHDAESFEQVVTLWRWADVTDAYAQPAVAATEAASASDASATLRDFQIDVTLRADALTAMMLAMVTFISTLVAIFAAGYMHGDRSYWRFFTYISLFVFSMTMLVSVSNFVLLFVFWEAVGVCSYLLIGFWYQKPEAAAAGKKAFLVNRVGDFGFALAIFLIWTTYGTLDFHDRPATDDAKTAKVTGEVEGNFKSQISDVKSQISDLKSRISDSTSQISNLKSEI